MCFAEIVIDFCSYIVSKLPGVSGGGLHKPCRVNVMLCSSFSSSAVRESGGR